MSINKFYQLVDVPDFRYEGNRSGISYSDIASDCDCKTVSLLNAIKRISLDLHSEVDGKEIDCEEVRNLSGVIFDLAELALATNKISHCATFLSGVQEGRKCQLK